jgi:hypothetical protein
MNREKKHTEAEKKAHESESLQKTHSHK